MKHQLLTLAEHSRYIDRHCPVTLQRLRIGESIVLCMETDSALRAIVFAEQAKTAQRCPVCDQAVYIPFASSQQQSWGPARATPPNRPRQANRRPAAFRGLEVPALKTSLFAAACLAIVLALIIVAKISQGTTSGPPTRGSPAATAGGLTPNAATEPPATTRPTITLAPAAPSAP